MQIVKNCWKSHNRYRTLKKADLQLNVIKDSYKEYETASKKVIEKVKLAFALIVYVSNSG